MMEIVVELIMSQDVIFQWSVIVVSQTVGVTSSDHRQRHSGM
jgi:hypothetical protein